MMHFYRWLLKTKKTTVESVDNQLLLSLKIMVPPIEEQKTIVAFLNYKCRYIDKILNDKQEQLNLLMQHKKSLIYEYVTGKKQVKEVQWDGHQKRED